MAYIARSYLMTYVAACVVCAVFLIYMTARMNRSLGNDSEILVFRHLTACGLVVIAVEIAWMSVVAGGNTAPRPFIVFINWCDLYFSAFVVFFIFRFVTMAVDPEVQLPQHKRRRVLLTIPMFVLAFFELASVKTGWIFYIDAQGAYHRGPLYAVQAIVLYFYCAMTFFVLAYFGLTKPDRRPTIRQMLAFLLCPVVGGVLQLFFQGVPFTILSFTLGTFILFVQVQSNRIETDALTGAYNRSVARRYFYHKYKSAASHPFYIIMADVDDFKGINDTYGHLSGDRALRVVTRALTEAAEDYPEVFISRYGGDEFLLGLEGQPETFIKAADAKLSQVIAEDDLPFAVTMTMGVSLANGRYKDVRQVIDAADRDLYRHKKLKKAERRNRGEGNPDD